MLYDKPWEAGLNIASDISNEYGYGEVGLVHEQSRARTGLSRKMLLNSLRYQLSYNEEFILSLYYYDVIIVIHS